MKHLKLLISNKFFIVVIYFTISIIATLQGLHGEKVFHEGGAKYTNYNNYLIFKQSFEHLIEKKDLYKAYPDEHWDLYKYTPTFSILFSPFYYMPDWLGLLLWNLANCFLLLYSIYYLPVLNNFQKGLILLFILIELLTSIQNQQSNALITGLLVFSFGLMERNKFYLASLCIIISFFIKIFGIVGFAIFLCYPNKIKNTFYSIINFSLLFILPLLFLNIAEYKKIIFSYMELLKNDHTSSIGFSVMGWLYTWFKLDVSKLTIVLIGSIIFITPYLKFNCYHKILFKYLLLCSTLIWIVIFNHKAESPTFIIAFTGVSIWFVISEKTFMNKLLFLLGFIFTSLSVSDIFPSIIRNELILPYAIKGVPCIIIWIKIIYDLLNENNNFSIDKNY